MKLCKFLSKFDAGSQIVLWCPADPFLDYESDPLYRGTIRNLFESSKLYLASLCDYDVYVADHELVIYIGGPSYED